MKVDQQTLGTAIVGCGLIGRRRAAEADLNARSRVVGVFDPNSTAAEETARDNGAVAASSYEQLLSRQDVDVVAIATPNAFIEPIARFALSNGKHVLLEKPMGRNLAEAHAIAEAAHASSSLVKVGFNHRYHPALAEAHRILTSGALGAPINARAVYGHGGRPGYENEWRGNPQLAGGGEATDQGIHIFDLFHWFLGVPFETFATLQTAVWPIAPLEDNAWGLLRYAGGGVASFHTSWTQWKNRFSLEVFCEKGSIRVDGLGKSYGPERLVITHRNMTGGIPHVTEQVYDEPDLSWRREWEDFVSAIVDRKPYMGGPSDGIIAMATLDAVYRSATSNVPVALATL